MPTASPKGRRALRVATAMHFTRGKPVSSLIKMLTMARRRLLMHAIIVIPDFRDIVLLMTAMKTAVAEYFRPAPNSPIRNQPAFSHARRNNYISCMTSHRALIKPILKYDISFIAMSIAAHDITMIALSKLNFKYHFPMLAALVCVAVTRAASVIT